MDTNTSETPSRGAPPAAISSIATETAVANSNAIVAQAPARGNDIALTVLATIAFIFSLQWAREFLIPLVFGILIAYTLNPLVVWLERCKIPRLLGTSLVMLSLFGSASLVASSVYTQAQTIVDKLPMATYKFSHALKASDDGTPGVLGKLRNAADALKQAASSSSDNTQNTADASTATSLPDINLTGWLWAGSLSAAAFAGQVVMILFLVFFALLSGDTFKRKLVRLTGPSLSQKKITVQILDNINTSIQRYMLMLLVTNTLLGLVTWAALYWIGIDNAGAWSVAAALLHIIPYFGSLIAAVAIGLAGFLQYESFPVMLLASAATLGIATLVGTLVTTWMTGRIAKMNAMAVFVALLFGGWLWGVWGLLLCVPIIVVIKVFSEHIEGMQPIAELLGE